MAQWVPQDLEDHKVDLEHLDRQDYQDLVAWRVTEESLEHRETQESQEDQALMYVSFPFYLNNQFDQGHLLNSYCNTLQPLHFDFRKSQN